MLIKFKKLRDVHSPTQSYEAAAGFDFYIPVNWQLFENKDIECAQLLWESKIIYPNMSIVIPSGIQINMPPGVALRMENKSGKAIQGLLVGASIIDQDYQGEMHLNLWNVSKEPIIVKQGDKLVQGIFFNTLEINLYEIHPTEQLFTEPSSRGQSGFGSTDKINK